MKTTQILTNIKFWQSTLFAFVFLFSLSIFSQVDATSAAVGDELTFNGMAQTDGDEGVAGSGTGCSPCGWNAMQGFNYAPTNNNNNNGACHSENRQFKAFATNGNNGSFINQEITALPAGTFTYDYWTKWAGVPTYTDENGDTLEPKFTIRVPDGNGGWTAAHEVVIPLSADQEWTQTTGTWTNDEVRDVRLQWYKRGGTNAAPTGLNKSMFVDSVSFTYTEEASTSTPATINITTSGGSYATEKWVNITTETGGAGTQVWGQGDGTYGNGQGLINQDIEIDPGTYYVNAYDRYSDGWDGTQLSVTQNGAVLASADSPSDPNTNDSSGSWETPDVELEGSYEIVVADPNAISFSPGCDSNVIVVKI